MTWLPGGSLTKGLGSASGALAISLSRSCQASSGVKQRAVAGWNVALASSFNDRSPCGGSVPEQPPYRQAKESEVPRRPDDGRPLLFLQHRRTCLRFDVSAYASVQEASPPEGVDSGSRRSAAKAGAWRGCEIGR